MPDKRPLSSLVIRSFHIIHNVVDRGVLQAMWEELGAKLDTVNNLLSANHAYLKTLYWMQVANSYMATSIPQCNSPLSSRYGVIAWIHQSTQNFKDYAMVQAILLSNRLVRSY